MIWEGRNYQIHQLQALLSTRYTNKNVSLILRLLFRHFSQRQEVLRSFGQVQLLVSDCDVKSYKQIKDDLDDLRLLVEKSELWVYKTVKQEDKKVGNIYRLPSYEAVISDNFINRDQNIFSTSFCSRLI